MTGEELGKLLVSQTRSYIDKTLSPVMAKLDALESRLDGIPAPKDGADGRDGIDGKDADMVVILSEVRQAVDEAVAEAVKAIPVPADGKDGEPGPQGEAGPKGDAGERGEPGKDGADVVGAIRDADGHLILTLSNGLTKDVGRVVGHDGAKGADGKDGSDGFGWEDMEEFAEDDGRTLVRRYSKGERVKEFRHRIGTPLDRGVFDASKTYSRGDGVTYGGAWWIAQEETGEQPGTSKAWRLAVKKGRDGKDGVMKPAPEAKTVKVK